MSTVQVSELEYKKNLLGVIPTISDIKQIVVFNRQIFALNNSTGNISRLNENNVWVDVRSDGVITNHLLPVGDVLYAGTDTGLYVWQGDATWALVDDGARIIHKLISFGGFIHAVIDTNRKVERWVGTSWAQVGSIPVIDVQDLSVFNDQLYSGGASGVRRWTGSSWSQLGSIGSAVNVLHIFNNQLHAATSAAVSRWSGSSWVVLQSLSGVNSMANLKGGLYASNSTGVHKRVGLSWVLISSLTGIRSLYPLGPVLLLANSGNLRRLTSAAFENDTVSLIDHGFSAGDEVFVKCITGGFVSTTFTIASGPLTNSFVLTPPPDFVPRENLNYTRSGATLTIKYPGHGLVSGNKINIISPVSSPSLSYVNPLTVTVLNDNEINVSVTGGTILSGSNLAIEKISGEVLVAEMTYSLTPTTISRNSSTGVVTISQANHGYAKGDSLYIKVPSSNTAFDSSPTIVESVINPDSYRIVKKMDPGSFYSKFGVKEFHESKIYGKGVSIYVIDEGFNDTDPNIPGIQPISDLADFEAIDFGDNGAGTSLSHGGLVGGLIGASRKNGAGIIGVSPDAKLYIADVDDTQGSIFISKVVQAIDDAVSRGVDIINLSLGTSFSSSSLEQAVRRAINANIIVFASAGNSGSSIYEYPAAFDGVISVASVNYSGQASSFNTRNEKVAIFAPGENYPLPSPVSEETVVRVDGTSFASPYAAGLTALYIQKKRIELGDPSWRPTRENIVTDIPQLLGTQGLSYAAPGITPIDLFSGDVVETLAYVGIALVGIAILAIFAMKIIK